MKKFLIFLIIFIFLCSNAIVVAQTEEESTPSADDEVIKQQVQERIENVVKEAEENKKQALVGTLKSIANSSLTLTTGNGDVQIKIHEEATIIDEDRNEIEIEDLEIGSNLIVMGYSDAEAVFDARRIAVTGEFQVPATESVFGTVTDISSEEKILTIKNPKTDMIYTIELESGTEISKRIEEEIEEIEFSDIEENDNLVVIGETEENAEKMITAKLIHVVSGETVIIEEEEEEEISE